MFPENDWRYYLMHSDDKDMKYGLPGKKKYPMPDREHVRSAIKFFNYVSPSDEKELARNIIARIKEYRIVGINVGKNNRFGKYYKPRPLIHSGIQGMKLGVKNDYRSHLEHHGVPGMHWGIRRYQNVDGTLTAAGKKRYSIIHGNEQDKELIKDLVKNYSSANLSEWGESEDKNILYITGMSGSGKSTVADKLSKKFNAQVIHLDPYLGMMSQESRDAYQNKDFNKFLKQNVPDYKDVVNDDGRLNYKIVDKIAKASEDYGKKKFGKERVIIEGVQLFDETFYESRDFYKDKPVMALKTNPIVSNWRGSNRDSEHVFDTISLFAYRMPMSIKTGKAVKKFQKDLNLK